MKLAMRRALWAPSRFTRMSPLLLIGHPGPSQVRQRTQTSIVSVRSTLKPYGRPPSRQLGDATARRSTQPALLLKKAMIRRDRHAEGRCFFLFGYASCVGPLRPAPDVLRLPDGVDDHGAARCSARRLRIRFFKRLALHLAAP